MQDRISFFELALEIGTVAVWPMVMTVSRAPQIKRVTDAAKEPNTAINIR